MSLQLAAKFANSKIFREVRMWPDHKESIQCITEFLDSEVKTNILNLLNCIIAYFPDTQYCNIHDYFTPDQDAGSYLDLTVTTGDHSRDAGHLLVLASISPVIASLSNCVMRGNQEADFSLILPDSSLEDYHNLLALLYGGPER